MANTINQLSNLRRDVSRIITGHDVHTLPEGNARILEAASRLISRRKATDRIYEKHRVLIQGKIETDEISHRLMPVEHRLEEILAISIPETLLAAAVQLVFGYHLNTQFTYEVMAKIVQLIEREGGPAIEPEALY